MNKKTALYTEKKEGTNMIGTIYLPKGSGCGQKVKYFDAIEWGIPVEIDYKEKMKIIDQERFNKMLEKHLVDGKDLEGHCFEKCIFNNVSFASLSLYNLVFKNCSFLNCIFNDARLHDCLFVDSTLKNSSFIGSVCYMNAKNVTFLDCNFTKATVAQARFDECTFKNCDLSNNYVHRSSFFKNKLEKPDFTSSTFNTVYFHDCTIHEAVYEGLVITMGGATSEEVSTHRNLIMAAFA